MAVVLDEYKIFYAAVPKIGCTSIKLAFFELENGFAFPNYLTNGRRRHIHDSGYQTWLRKRFPEQRIAAYYKTAFVRDPLERFISAYNNRVLQHRELSEELVAAELKKLDLAPTPDLSRFIDQYEDYLKVHQSIWHHTRPMTHYLGDDPDYFSRIYRLSEMNDFKADIENQTGKEFRIGHSQTGSKIHTVKDLTRPQRRKLLKLYEDDLKAFSKYF